MQFHRAACARMETLKTGHVIRTQTRTRDSRLVDRNVITSSSLQGCDYGSLPVLVAFIFDSLIERSRHVGSPRTQYNRVKLPANLSRGQSRQFNESSLCVQLFHFHCRSLNWVSLATVGREFLTGYWSHLMVERHRCGRLLTKFGGNECIGYVRHL
jgi:hypothetical protein